MAQAREWPNKMGWDVGNAEVMKITRAGRTILKVSTPSRMGLVQSTIEPIEAVRITRLLGNQYSQDLLIATGLCVPMQSHFGSATVQKMDSHENNK